MAGVKLKLGTPEVAARVDTMHAREPDGWRKTRLLAVKLAARGERAAAPGQHGGVFPLRGVHARDLRPR